MTYGFIISVNGGPEKRLEEYSPDMQQRIRQASYSTMVQALGYKKKVRKVQSA